MAVPYTELANSPSEVYSASGFQATMKVVFPWKQRKAFFIELLSGGGLYPHDITLGAVVRGIKVDPYPDSEVEDLATGLGLADYTNGLATISYGIPDGETGGPLGEPEIDQSLEPSAEFLTQDAKGFAWKDGDKFKQLLPAEAPGKIFQSCEYVVTIRGSSALSLSILDKIGKCNSVSVFSDQLGVSFPAETLLFGTPSLTKNSNGTLNVTYRFTYRPNGWNKFWRPATQSWIEMYKLEPAQEGQDPTYSVYKAFPLTSFNDILT